jgi:PAS domain S-box-containing protein
VLTSIGDAVIATDGRGRVTFTNLVAQGLTGWAPDEAVGKSLDDVFRIVAEGTRQPVEPPVSRVLRDGAVVGLANHTLLIARDGSERPIADSAAPIRDQAGEVAGVVLVFRDVAEQRRAERERAELLDREREARAEAETANHAKDRFLAVLSHELRTPLTPVLMDVAALIDDPATPDSVRPALEAARRNVELEARLIDDLLDISRVARGTLLLNRQPVDVHDLVRRALDICRGDLRGGGFELTLDLAAAESRVEGDPARLQQVLWNLLKNAVKFTPSRGLVSVRSRNEAGPAGARLVVEVSDSGVGIEPASLSRIFDAFGHGGESLSSRRAGGLGLGLAISRSLAEAHGGRLTAASAGAGRGATFSLVLDVLAGASPLPSEQARVHLDGAPPRALKILLVEDDAATLRVLARLLRGRGHSVQTAMGVSEGLEAAAREAPDLVISDLGLPDGSGLDMMRVLRERRAVPAIALSGFGMDEDVRKSLAAGFAAHLTKPVDLSTLEEAFRRVLKG